jgi:hypothetical protein
MRRHALLLAASAALALAAGASRAQPQPSKATLNEGQKQDIVDTAVKALAESYIYPDRGRNAGKAIHDALADGRYNEISDRSAFAMRLTADLQAVTHDKHMRVIDPQGPPPPDMPAGPPPRSWAGFVRAARLQGNIGYIDLSGFPNPAMFRDAANAAMKSVDGTDALIIDMRGNGGGSPASVGYLCSFLFADGKPVHLNDLIWRNKGTETYRTQQFFTGPTPSHYLGKPVILITSHFTFSGGEEFTNDLKVLKRATVVGEVTGGGANPGGVQPLGSGLVLFVPAGRAENPTTKTSWEGVGVQPDTPTLIDDAFATAYRTALKTAKSSAERAQIAQRLDPHAGVEAWVEATLFRPRAGPSPQAEAALRKVLAQIAAGDVDYTALDPELVADVKAQAPNVRRDMAGLGALKAVTFKQVDGLGSDVYHATFEHGEMDWVVYVNDEGRIANIFYPRPPSHTS